MARLPDVTSFGERPTPQPRATVIGVSGTAAPQLAAAAEGTEKVGATLLNLGDRMMLAEQRIRAGREVVERSLLGAGYEEWSAGELRRLSVEGDLSSLDETASYGKSLMQRRDEILSQHKGSEDSRIKLLDKLERQRFKMIGEASRMGMEANKKKLETLIGSKTNAFVSRAYDDPMALGEGLLALDGEIEDASFGLTLEQQAQLRAAGREQITEATINGFLDRSIRAGLGGRGAVDEAERLLSAPDIEGYLGPAAQKRLRTRINDWRLKSMEPEQLVEIGDPTSPTGSRFVPRSQAVGQPGRARQPLVSMPPGESSFSKAIGELTAKNIEAVHADADKAMLDLAEIERIQAALDSGKFTTGVFSSARYFVAQFAEFIGASPEVKGLIGDAATADTLDAATKRLAINEIPKLERTVVAGIKLITESLPALSRTPEGNRILVEVLRRVAERRIQIADMAGDIFDTDKPLEEKRVLFRQRKRDLEKDDPLITPELRQKIMEGTKDAPKSFVEAYKEAFPQGITGVLPTTAPKPSPVIGAIEQGHRFLGGDPADPKSWEKVK